MQQEDLLYVTPMIIYTHVQTRTHARTRTQFSGDVDLWPELTPCCDLHYSAALRPLWDESAQECQESNGSDLYSPQISSCTGTKREPPSKATQYSNTN